MLMANKRTLSYLLLVSLLVMLGSVLGPSGAGAYAVPNSRGGMNAQWYYGTDAELNTAADQAKAAGVQWVRIDLKWSLVQPTNATSWDWTWPDKMVNKALSRGLGVILVASYSPSWANGGHSDDRYYPSDVNAWKTFLDTAARRYLPLGATVFELWNEPNNSPQSSPALYTSNILKPGSDAIRAASSDVHVPVTILNAASASLLGVSGIVDPYAWLDGIYANGGKDYFDAEAVHPYCWPLAPTTTSTYNHLLRTVELHNTMAAYGDGGKQIWATEFGYPTQGPNTVTEQQQSDYIASAFQVWTQSSWLSWTGPMILYTYKDGGVSTTDPELNFGLIRSDWTFKPIMNQLPTIMASVPPAPAVPTSGYNSASNPPPASGTTLISGFESASQWTGEAAVAADTAHKTEGGQSLKATYPVNTGWKNFNYAIASPYLNLGSATELKLDVYPYSQTPGTYSEPVELKLHDVTGGVIYEQQLPHLTANQWNTVTVSLTGIAAANRQKLDYIDLYLYSGFTGEIGGRTSVAYGFDNLRFTPTAINGFENTSQWAGEATGVADTAHKTEGNQSIKATYAVSSGWKNFYTDIASPYLNLSAAASIKLDVYPLSQTPGTYSEPIQLKLHDVTGGVIYEQQLPHLTANQWNTVTINLSGIAAANRQKIDNINLYLWSGFTNEIGGRASVGYYFDNLRNG
ncbi:cellulase family glycosylhydrolase [Paenibacillus rhizovicinus]|uniref:Cellulase family glycosylhydrolase n=1 Tax=Paenibacillus rhizovicinus TaxID=2704463 RepID=A0A6C0NXD7_9BACL|nr:cellulase family glycosylhydrolase [Paenibacillus rhizovicinus]QHW30801.1 cellulase family glycosylhydrolase [Paenibacillus rhizovicinus]